MSKGTITNMRASVLARLKNLSRLCRQDYQHILMRYATERFLYRLSVSGYADNLISRREIFPGNIFVRPVAKPIWAFQGALPPQKPNLPVTFSF